MNIYTLLKLKVMDTSFNITFRYKFDSPENKEALSILIKEVKMANPQFQACHVRGKCVYNTLQRTRKKVRTVSHKSACLFQYVAIYNTMEGAVLVQIQWCLEVASYLL